MAQVEFAEDAFAKIEQLDEIAPGAAALILEVTSMLEVHPLIGRSVEDDLRELVISRGKTGYVALYRLNTTLDVVFVLAVRHQREAGYSRK